MASLTFLCEIRAGDEGIKSLIAQLTFTCSKSKIEALEKGVKYVQS